jgi:TfoX/Sxy family transcriptional regulator of competence genes
MPADETLAARVRAVLAGTPDLEEKPMFGGLCFLVHGHLCAGIVGSTLMVRVGPAEYADAVARPHVRPMDFGSQSPTGMVFIDPPAMDTAETLAAWVGGGARYAATLPARPE